MNAQEYTRLNIKNAVKLFFSFSLGVWVQAIVNLFSVPIITYLISPQEFGKATMYSVAYNLLLIITLMGMDQSFIRSFYEVRTEDRPKLLWSSIAIPLSFYGIISIILLVMSNQASKLLIGEKDARIGYMISISLITGILQSFNANLIRMQKKGILFSAIYSVQAIANVTTTVLYALYFGKNFYAIIWGQIFGNLTAFLIGFIFEHSYILPVQVDLALTKKLLNYGLPLVPSSVIWWLFQFTSRFSLRMLSNFTELGYYGIAFKLSTVMALIQAGFSNFWIPIAYETYEKDRENTKLFENAAELITLLMVSFALLVILFKDIIFLIMSKSYSEAAPVLPYLLFSPVILTILTVTARGINFLKKTYWFAVSDSIALVINLVGNIILVPRLGARGAAFSTAISFLVLFTIETTVSMSLFRVKYPLSKIYGALLVLFISAGIGTFLNKIIINILVSFVSFIFLLLFFREAVRKGIEQSKSFINKKRGIQSRFPPQG